MSSLQIYSDGGARGNPGPAAAAFVVKKQEEIIEEQSIYLGDTTNNIAEYQGILLAVNWLIENTKVLKSVNEVLFHLDSLLVVKQLNGEYRVKNENIKKPYNELTAMLKQISCTKRIIHIPRGENRRADFLVNKCLDENMRNFT